MTEATTEKTNKVGDQKADWQAAASASAEAQQPEDPAPRYFIEELDVKLSPAAHVAVAMKYADVRDEIDDFDLQTKADAAERKAERAKLLAHAKDLQSQTRTGRVKRKVRCAEITSFVQNRKFKVRLDQKDDSGNYVEIAETPLSQAERQGNLPLENKAPPEELDELEIGDDLDEEEDELDLDPCEGADEESTLSSHDDQRELTDEPDSTTNITDPDAVADGVDVEPTPLASPPSKPIDRAKRKSRSSRKN
jgi:hypothetical protein